MKGAVFGKYTLLQKQKQEAMGAMIRVMLSNGNCSINGLYDEQQ